MHIVVDMRMVLVMVAMLTGCMDGVRTIDPPAPDAQTKSCPQAEDVSDFGEACVSAPYPANTLCHDDKGWCIDNVCQPQCFGGCCTVGDKTYAPAGACYCAL